MPPQPEPMPSGLTEWVSRQHPGCYAKFVKPEYISSDAWNGSVYIFELRQPGIPKSVFRLQGCAFQLSPSSVWSWQLLGGPEALDPKSAVLRVKRSSA